jgi:hypothetical protein
MIHHHPSAVPQRGPSQNERRSAQPILWALEKLQQTALAVG